MTDTVFKGNGKGYIFRGELPATYEEFRQAVLAGQFCDLSLNLSSGATAGADVIGTPLNKANLLSDATGASCGATTVDGALAYLASKVTEDESGRIYDLLLRLYIAGDLDLYFGNGILIDSFRANNFSSLTGWTWATGKITATGGASGLYNYDVYSVISGGSHYEQGTPVYSSTQRDYPYTVSGYESFTFSASTGWTVSGSYVSREASSVGDSYTVYNLVGTSLKAETTSYPSDDDIYYYESRVTPVTVVQDEPSRGSYLYATTGSASQYPQNGVSGNYWYVRGEPVASGSTATAVTDSYELDEDASSVMLVGVDSVTNAHATISYQVTLDGENWNAVTPGVWTEIQPGSDLSVRIVANFDGSTVTAQCDGVAVIVR